MYTRACRYKFKRSAGQPLVMHFNNAKGDVAPFVHTLEGSHCPTSRWGVCTLTVSVAPVIFTALCAAAGGRALAAGVTWAAQMALRRVGVGFR